MVSKQTVMEEKVLFLELGVGYNTPVIIKYPLRFPVYYDGQEDNENRMPDKNTVETVCSFVQERTGNDF